MIPPVSLAVSFYQSAISRKHIMESVLYDVMALEILEMFVEAPHRPKPAHRILQYPL